MGFCTKYKNAKIVQKSKNGTKMQKPYEKMVQKCKNHIKLFKIVQKI